MTSLVMMSEKMEGKETRRRNSVVRVAGLGPDYNCLSVCLFRAHAGGCGWAAGGLGDRTGVG